LSQLAAYLEWLRDYLDTPEPDEALAAVRVRKAYLAARRLLLPNIHVPDQLFSIDGAKRRLDELREELRTASPPAQPLPESAPGETLPTPLVQFLSAPDLARLLDQPVPRVETFLRRFREDHRDCFVETGNPRKNEARYLYRTAEVWPALREQLTKWQER
jgi:hypothetical protein